jgi:hypothetical protein
MPDSPKVKHGNSQMEGGRRILSPEEVKRLGIPTDPVLVISPVPRTPSKGSQNTKEPKSTTPASKTSPDKRPTAISDEYS